MCEDGAGWEDTRHDTCECHKVPSRNYPDPQTVQTASIDIFINDYADSDHTGTPYAPAAYETRLGRLFWRQ